MGSAVAQNTSVRDMTSNARDVPSIQTIFIQRHFYLLCALGTLNASVRGRWYRRTLGKPYVYLGGDIA